MVAQKRCGIAIRRCLHVVVQVAVAQVAKVHQLHAGQGLLQHGIRHFYKFWSSIQVVSPFVINVAACSVETSSGSYG